VPKVTNKVVTKSSVERISLNEIVWVNFKIVTLSI